MELLVLARLTAPAQPSLLKLALAQVRARLVNNVQMMLHLRLSRPSISIYFQPQAGALSRINSIFRSDISGKAMLLQVLAHFSKARITTQCSSNGAFGQR